MEDDFVAIADATRRAILREVEALGLQARRVGPGPEQAVGFVRLGRGDLWTYTASVDLSDTQGTGHLLATVGRASEDHPVSAADLRKSGASCTEELRPNFGKLTTCSWNTPSEGGNIVVNKVTAVLETGEYIDITCTNQDSQSSVQTREEPPFDLSVLRRIAES